MIISFNDLISNIEFIIEKKLGKKRDRENERESRINFSCDRPPQERTRERKREGRLLLFIFFLVKVPGFQSHALVVT